MPLKLSGLFLAATAVLERITAQLNHGAKHAIGDLDLTAGRILATWAKIANQLSILGLAITTVLVLLTIPLLRSRYTSDRIYRGIGGLGDILNEQTALIASLNILIAESGDQATRYVQLAELKREAIETVMDEFDVRQKVLSKQNWVIAIATLILGVIATIIVAKVI